MQVRPDLSGHIDEIADNFRDYWVSATGSKSTKLNWLATWRVWVRNEKKIYSQVKTAQERRSERASATYDYDRAIKF